MNRLFEILLLAIVVLLHAGVNGQLSYGVEVPARLNDSQLVLDDDYGYYVLVNAEFRSNAFLDSIEYYAVATGDFYVKFLTFDACQERRGLCSSCKYFIYQDVIDFNRSRGVLFYEFGNVHVRVDKVGRGVFELPRALLVPRGYVPYIQQYRDARIALKLSDSRLADVSWSLANLGGGLKMSPLAVGNQSALFYARFNAKPAELSSNLTHYGLPIPLNASDTLAGPSGPFTNFYLINAEIRKASMIKSLEVFASQPGNVTFQIVTFLGCHESCARFLLNWRVNSTFYWFPPFSNSILPQIDVSLQQGYNNISLGHGFFAPENSVLMYAPTGDGRIALDAFNSNRLLASDLSNRPDEHGRLSRLGRSPLKYRLCVRVGVEVFEQTE